MLAADVAAGDIQISLKDDPTQMGWQVGDKIGIAATARDGQTQGLGGFPDSKSRDTLAPG